MEWTFDPLEIKNAFLNIHRLGVHRAGLYTEFLWCILISSAGWASHGPSPRGVVDGFGACEGYSERVPITRRRKSRRQSWCRRL